MNSETSYVVRIDGNPEYHYSKTSIKILDDNIYIVNHHIGGYHSYDYLCENLIEHTPFEPVRKLYTIIWENQSEIIKAVKRIDRSKKLASVELANCKKWVNNEPVKIKGVTVSIW